MVSKTENAEGKSGFIRESILKSENLFYCRLDTIQCVDNLSTSVIEVHAVAPEKTHLNPHIIKIVEKLSLL